MNLRRILVVPAALSLLAPPGRLGAQAQPDTAGRQRPIVLSPVIVTATRVPLPAVTAAATVITGEELRARGIEHVWEALREVPGAVPLQTGSYGGLTSLYLRGGESGYVKVLLDGVPLNDPGGAFDFAHLTTENIERIEIVRGPTSVLYGSDAVTGVVQIFTRRGAGAPEAAASVRAGTYGTRALDAGVSGGSGVASYAFDLAQFRTDGIYAFNNQYRHTALSGLVSLAPDPRTDLKLSLQYADDTAHIPTEGAGQVVDRNAFSYGDRTALGLELGYRFAPRLEGRLLLASHATSGGFDDRPDSPADTLGFYAFLSLDQMRRRSAEARLTAYLADRLALTAGGEVAQQTQRSFNQSESQYGPSYGTFDARRSNWAGYAEVVGTLPGGLALNLGSRLDDNQQFGRFLTYRAGLAYTVAGGTRLRAALGTAFREPTFVQNFAQGYARGNPDLEPEHTRSWEAGLEQVLAADRLRLAVTYFDQHFADLIEYTFRPPRPTDPNFFNVAGADATGLELEARVADLQGLSLEANYTYLDTRVTDPGFNTGPTGFFVAGQRLLRRPRHAASGRLAYRLARRSSVSASVSYLGERDDLDYAGARRVTLPAVTKLDLAFQYEVRPPERGTPGLVLTGRLDNALNRQYQAVFGYPAPGRALLVGARLGVGL